MDAGETRRSSPMRKLLMQIVESAESKLRRRQEEAAAAAATREQEPPAESGGDGSSRCELAATGRERSCSCACELEGGGGESAEQRLRRPPQLKSRALAIEQYDSNQFGRCESHEALAADLQADKAARRNAQPPPPDEGEGEGQGNDQRRPLRARRFSCAQPAATTKNGLTKQLVSDCARRKRFGNEAAAEGHVGTSVSGAAGGVALDCGDVSSGGGGAFAISPLLPPPTNMTNRRYNGADGPSDSAAAAELAATMSRAGHLSDEEAAAAATAAAAAAGRDGPTPTNDLIRTLLERDWRALCGGRADLARKQAARQDAADSPAPHLSTRGQLGGAARRKRRLDAAGQEQSRSPRKADKCIQISPEQSDEAEGDTESVAGQQRRRHSLAADVSALIGKCQRLQLSAAAPGGGGVSPYRIAARAIESMQEQRRRKTSDPPPARRDIGAGADSARGGRRHSTYMLPLVLLNKPANGAANDDEDDDDDASDDSADGDVEAARPAPLRNQQRQVLPSSASSPSALSTPTNDEGRGCGGPCCSEQAQLARMAAENASLSRQLFASSGTAVPSAVRDLAPSGRRRERVGSNPLDRRRLIQSNLLQRPNWQQPQHAAAAATGQSGNRAHSSIINLFAQSGSAAASKRPALAAATSAAATEQLVSAAAPRNRHLPTGDTPPISSWPANRGAWQAAGKTLSATACGGGGAGEQYEPLIPESGFKIVVMGTSNSGKTAIIQRFLYNTFSARHLPTVEDTYFIEFPYKKNTINISISDTSGTYQFPAMKRLAINSGDAFILVYSVDEPQSFDQLEQLRETILNEREQAFLEQQASASSISSSSRGGGGGSASSSSSSSLATAAAVAAAAAIEQSAPLNASPPPPPTQQPRHWSLANLFSHHPNQHRQLAAAGAPNATHAPFATSAAASLGSSSICSTTNSSSCSSSAESSRRSSISAAEAALRTRRTRRPPMVIVANKHDLPKDKHLVNSDEIEALVVIDWNNGFVRASAALNWNIDEIFQQVLKQARQPPTLTEAILSKRRKSLPPKLPNP